MRITERDVLEGDLVASLVAFYGAFNARCYDAALELLSENVCWRLGSDGTLLRGPEAIRRNWRDTVEPAVLHTYSPFEIVVAAPDQLEATVDVRRVDAKGAARFRATHYIGGSGARIELIEIDVASTSISAAT